ncbi:pentapeptide repeat-containing protein [Streptomyces plumbiresistens]|uniref:pentapeptide repeat-containing protein n=1 Tax=Streptomyces plumbiresistens TaxID=511811 RepID=UPI0031E9BC6C
MCDHGSASALPASHRNVCSGRVIEPFKQCLAHLTSDQQNSYFSQLAPGSAVDHRGTEFTQELLTRLLDALRESSDGNIRLGECNFGWAIFQGSTNFNNCTFSGVTRFHSATFHKDATFEGSRFYSEANFSQATFSLAAIFEATRFDGAGVFFSTQFEGEARFVRTVFFGPSSFTKAKFLGEADLSAASFLGPSSFLEAEFTKKTRFTSATFESEVSFDKSSFLETCNFSKCTFKGSLRFVSASFDDRVNYSRSRFEWNTQFQRTRFSGGANFGTTTFEQEADFSSVEFKGAASFSSTKFAGAAKFDSAIFDSEAFFSSTHFADDARFPSASFHRKAAFHNARFSTVAHFGLTIFRKEVNFAGAVFERTRRLGPLVCDDLVLTGAEFHSPATLEFSAKKSFFRRTHWRSTAALKVRCASVDLTDAVFEGPVTVTHAEQRFASPDGTYLNESILGAVSDDVRIVSLQGVDVAHLLISNIDLSECIFTGSIHLDQLRLEGTCRFAEVPSGIRRSSVIPIVWTPRRVLAEENHWRAARHTNPGGWTPAPAEISQSTPGAISAVYRQLRKSFEDGKNEPDAADFYYGEMDMRRNDRQRPRSERGILTAYWLLSGYGLRAARALAWLFIAMILTLFSLILWGIPEKGLSPVSSGTVQNEKISLSTRTPVPAGPEGSLADRITSTRLEKGMRVVMNSVVFRSSNQTLTTSGSYIEMAARTLEPILLGLAILAIRGRIKR